MSSDPLCLVFIPALIAILTAAEKKKGMPLTEAEVCHIRDQATCIALPFRDAPINLLRSGGESQFARHPALFAENGLMQRALRDAAAASRNLPGTQRYLLKMA
ncbi:hypothetical protein AO286_10840 [Pseudomonas syringae]|uniref:hypothetical protein n=1 Tax=Pseudomonas syringae TaxID=317 RepID=UPI000C088751|nr:hypothetical protein [Pseudomonas syringae]PHN71576.1 hypothetical protein AO286_10840 [Pseudomonas syringae]